MALKSKINIDVDSASFNETFELFQRYQKAVKKTPGQWAFYHSQIKSVANTADKLTKFYEEHTASLAEAAVHHTSFSDAASKAGKVFSRFAHEVKETTGRLASIAGSLFKISLITGLVSGLLGGGFGFYVLDRSAWQVSERRRSALGLGVGYGQLQSFNTNFSRFGIGGETLGAASTGLYDFTSPQYMGLLAGGALGGGGNAANSTVELLKKLPQIFAGVPDGMIGPTAEARGLTQLLSLNQIVAYLHASDEERQQQIRAFGADSAAMNIPPDVAEKWSRFTATLSTAEKSITSVMAENLVGLADPLAHLSGAVSDFLSDASTSAALTEGIQKLSGGIEWLDSELGSKEAKEYMDVFLSGMVELNKVAGRALSLVAGLARSGYNVYKLINDPNYNPTTKHFIEDLINSAAPETKDNPPFVPNDEPGGGGQNHTASEHPHPSIHWGTGNIHLAPGDRASQAPLHQPTKLPGAVAPTPAGGTYTPYPPDLPTGKQSMLNQLRGARTAYAIVINNETGSSANVSAQRIPIAT